MWTDFTFEALNTFNSLVICFILVDWIHDIKYTYFYMHFYQFNTPLKAPKKFKYTILEKIKHRI